MIRHFYLNTTVLNAAWYSILGRPVRLRMRLLWFVFVTLYGLRMGIAQEFRPPIPPSPADTEARQVTSAAHVSKLPEVFFPQSDISISIRVECERGTWWQQGQMKLWLLEGPVHVRQGGFEAGGDSAVIWVDEDDDPAAAKKLIVYIEGNARVQLPRANSASNQPGSDQIVDDSWVGRIYTSQQIDVVPKVTVDGGPAPKPAIVARAELIRASQCTSSVQPVQFVQAANNAESTNQSLLISPQTGVVQSTIPATSSPQVIRPGIPAGRSPSATRVEFFSRQETIPLNVRSFPGSVPGETVTVFSGGARLVINSQEISQLPDLGDELSKQVNILADSAVWWQSDQELPGGQSVKRNEVYLEGNIVFNVGRRTIYADRMYYDATYHRGTILRAEFLTPTRSYEGLVRLKADVMQQLDDNRFQAFGAAVTGSRIGVPRYWLQSDRVSVDGVENYDIDPDSGAVNVDPQTGQPLVNEEYFAESRGNRVYVGTVPLFYWPSIRTSLEDPNFYLKSLKVGSDRIFGTQVRARLDLYQLFGSGKKIPGTQWIGAVDYLSDRGVGLGTDYEYHLNSLFGLPGKVDGFYRSWFIRDGGLDTLGRDRARLAPEKDLRGFIFLNHRQQLTPDFELKAEVGYIRDRNFLEQYYQQDWDWRKDYTTGFLLERRFGNQSLDLWTQLRMNDFFTQTNWLPRADHFVLGQSWWGDLFVYHAHSQIGYASFLPADAPLNPRDLAKFDPLAWETSRATEFARAPGTKLICRSKQVRLNSCRTFWPTPRIGRKISTTKICSASTGKPGSASIPFFRFDPTIHSTLFNVNGLAHKVSIDAEFAYADASQNFDRLPLYDPLDDDSQEFFRRRFAFDTFGILPGGDVPLMFDERDFARRYGMQGYVTSPTAEVADDALYIKTGLRNRWQTKRGGSENIIDWITFDVGATIFPYSNRDNFGDPVGLLDYDFRWFIGDRLSLLSDGFCDFFPQGLRTISLGASIQRPLVGDVYLGIRSIEGPISSNVLTTRWTYRMSDKWGVQANSMYDFGSTGNIGQRIAAVYIGESFLFQFGVNYDVSRDNVSFLFGMEPRFLVRPQLFRPGFQALPAPSSQYLE